MLYGHIYQTLKCEVLIRVTAVFSSALSKPVYLAIGPEVEMPTAFDYFIERAWRDHQLIAHIAAK